MTGGIASQADGLEFHDDGANDPGRVRMSTRTSPSAVGRRSEPMLQAMEHYHQAADQARAIGLRLRQVEQQMPHLGQCTAQLRHLDEGRRLRHSVAARFSPAARSRGASRSARSAATTAAGATRQSNSQRAACSLSTR